MSDYILDSSEFYLFALLDALLDSTQRQQKFNNALIYPAHILMWVHAKSQCTSRTLRNMSHYIKLIMYIHN